MSIHWSECQLVRARRAADGVIEVQIKRRAWVDAQSASDAVALFSQLAGHAPAHALVDLARVQGSASELGSIYRQAGALVARVAVVASSRLGRMVARAMLELHRPHIPARIFGDHAEARAWLLG